MDLYPALFFILPLLEILSILQAKPVLIIFHSTYRCERSELRNSHSSNICLTGKPAPRSGLARFVPAVFAAYSRAIAQTVTKGLSGWSNCSAKLPRLYRLCHGRQRRFINTISLFTLLTIFIHKNFCFLYYRPILCFLFFLLYFPYRFPILVSFIRSLFQ